MELSKILKGRKSIREYKSKDIPWNLLVEVLDAARYAPSSGNLQNWKFIVVEDSKLRKEIAEIGDQKWMEQAPVQIVICNMVEPIKREYGPRGEALYSVQNCAIAGYSLMLKAYELGLATCWVGAFDESELRELLKIDKKVRPQAIITLGYANEKGEKKVRDPLENFVFFGEYGERERIGSYEDLPLEKPLKRGLKKLKSLKKK